MPTARDIRAATRAAAGAPAKVAGRRESRTTPRRNAGTPESLARRCHGLVAPHDHPDCKAVGEACDARGMLRADPRADDGDPNHVASAMACAVKASSMAVKQWTCVIAVSVRSRISATSRGKYGSPQSDASIRSPRAPLNRIR